MALYPYKPLELPGPSTRLLRIAKGVWPNDIRCSLIEASLAEDDLVSYKALSHTWGGLKNAGFLRLYVDGFDIEVKDSLLMALRYIRQESEDIYLWVDALCINQDDDNEKGYQVNQMGLVYETADEVIVWLGPLAEGIKPLFGLINELDEQMAVYNRESDHNSWMALCPEAHVASLDLPRRQKRPPRSRSSSLVRTSLDHPGNCKSQKSDYQMRRTDMQGAHLLFGACTYGYRSPQIDASCPRCYAQAQNRFVVDFGPIAPFAHQEVPRPQGNQGSGQDIRPPWSVR
jgi:hypothetical protein